VTTEGMFSRGAEPPLPSSGATGDPDGGDLRARRGACATAAAGEIPRPARTDQGLLGPLPKYWAILRINLASQTAYLGEMVVRALFLAIILYVYLQLWTATYGSMGARTVAGFSVGQMVWYLLLTEAIVLSRPRLTRDVDQDVRAGDIAYQLIRPYDYVWYRLALYAGERLLRFALCLGVGGVVALALTGEAAIAPTGLVVGGLLFVVGLLVDFLGAMAIGLCAFWLEETQPLTLLYDRAIMLLGGMLLPLELLPDPVERALGALPFQLLLYAPARAAVSGDLAPFPSASCGLALTLAAMLLLVRLIYGQALRRLHANGG